MKCLYVLLCIVFCIGCSDDEPTSPNPTSTASRNIADYMYSGTEGTEYWVEEKITVIDTNNHTRIRRKDTVAVRIVNRNFNHPSFGSCIQTVDLYPHSGYSVRDTVYYRLKNDTIHVSYSSVNEPDPKLIETLRAPLQKGTATQTAGAETEITDVDVPITTSAGTFSAIVVKGSSKDKITEYLDSEQENEYYFIEKALFAKIVQKVTLIYKYEGKKEVTLREYTLIHIKNAQ